jgi:hypothetical protein
MQPETIHLHTPPLVAAATILLIIVTGIIVSIIVSVIVSVIVSTVPLDDDCFKSDRIVQILCS